MTLDIPSRVPLPPDVRQRALDTVLGGLDAPGPRRFRPELVAAAVVVALLVGLTVALSGGGRQDPPLVAAAPAGPTDEVDIRTTEGMISRCAAALDGVPGYPAPAQWRVELLTYSTDGDAVIVVDDAFACGLDPLSVTVSAIGGTPIGDASAVSLGPSAMVLFNPLRRPIVLDPPDRSGAAPDEAVQFHLVSGPEVPRDRITVGDSYTGPLPQLAAPVVTVQDRVLPMRPAYESPEATADDNDVELCASSWSSRDLWTPLRRIDDGPVPLLLTRIGDQAIGLCVLAADGPSFVFGPMPALEGTTFDPGDPVPAVVVRLTFEPGGATSYEPWTEAPRADCVIPDGVAICGDPATGALTIRLLAPSEDLTVPRAPGR